MKFSTIKTRSQALGQVQKHQGYGGLASRVDDLIDQARINADDTVHGEQAAAADQYDTIALASLESLLAYSTDTEVCAWFTKQGVRW